MRAIAMLSGTPSAIARKRCSRSSSSTWPALRSLMSVTVVNIPSWPWMMIARADSRAHMTLPSLQRRRTSRLSTRPSRWSRSTQTPAIAGLDIGVADRVGLRPDPEPEGLERELVGKQHLGLSDPRDHDRQRDRVGDPAQQLLALLELDLGGLAGGDVAGQQHPAAARQRALAHPHPAAVGDPEFLVLGLGAVMAEASGDEILAHVRVVHAAALARRPHHRLEARAEPEMGAKGGWGVIGIAAVVVDEAVVAVVDRQPVHQAAGGREKVLGAGSRLAFGDLGGLLGRLQLGGPLRDAALEHLVGALQGGLGIALGGHVADAADQALGAAVGIEHMLAGLVQPAQLVVGIAEPVFDRIGAALLPGLLAQLPIARAIVDVDPALEPLRRGQQGGAVGHRQAVDARHLVGAPQAAFCGRIDDEAAEIGQPGRLAAQHRLLRRRNRAGHRCRRPPPHRPIA